MRSRTRRLLVAATSVVAILTTVGCGLLSQAQQLVNAAQTLGDFANTMQKAATLTYTAEYKTTDGDTIKLVQQPPNVAYLGKDSRYIFTKEFLYLCQTDKGQLACQKTANSQSSVSSADGAFIAGVAGPGFMTPQLALAMVLAASLVPGAKVDKSEKTIAGQHSLCVTAAGLDAAASPGDTSAPKDFTVCITDNGVLASFSGTGVDGKQAAIEMTSYSTSADPSSFQPPADAKITDVTSIGVTPSPSA